MITKRFDNTGHHPFFWKVFLSK